MTQQSADGHANARGDGAAKTVLVVEDNDLNMMMFHDVLEARGYRVLKAPDGMTGWRLAQEHRPDLILMDIQLPDVSGLEVTGWLKDDETLKSIPVVAVTAFAMVGDKETYLAAGCDAYVSKPVSVTDFVKIVSEITDAPRADGQDETPAPNRREVSAAS